MKRFCALFFVLFLLVSLIACKDNSQKTDFPENETVMTPQTTESKPFSQEPTDPIETEVNRIKSEYDQLYSLRLQKLVLDNAHYLLTNSPAITSGCPEKLTMSLALDLNSSEAALGGVNPDAQYTDMSTEDCYFDVYFKSVNSTHTEVNYHKASLKVHIASAYSNYYCYQCTFYENLYPHMEVGGQYKLIIVAREGDMILGWTEDWFEWSETTDQTVKNLAVNEQYAK